MKIFENWCDNNCMQCKIEPKICHIKKGLCGCGSKLHGNMTVVYCDKCGWSKARRIDDEK